MKTTTIIVCLLMLVACSKQTDPKPTIIAPVFQLDATLKPYYDEFIAQATKRSIKIDQPENIVLQFSPLTTTEHGTTTKEGQHTVSIDVQYFNDNPNYRETVIFHQLGHCFLNRKESSLYSLMNTAVSNFGWPCTGLDNYACSYQKVVLWNELFNNQGK